MMDSEEEEEQTALVCDNGKFYYENVTRETDTFCYETL